MDCLFFIGYLQLWLLRNSYVMPRQLSYRQFFINIKRKTFTEEGVLRFTSLMINIQKNIQGESYTLQGLKYIWKLIFCFLNPTKKNSYRSYVKDKLSCMFNCLNSYVNLEKYKTVVLFSLIRYIYWSNV